METLFLSRPFQNTISIQIDDADTIRKLKLKFGKYIKNSCEKADLNITVKARDTEFIITTDNAVYVAADALYEIECFVYRNTTYIYC